MRPRLARTNWDRLVNVEAPAAFERHALASRPLRPVLRKRPALVPAGMLKPMVLRSHRVAA